ncbi:hypothetical protein P7C70_g7721, partial [Phenoliferia sp. Uapishka_3]
MCTTCTTRTAAPEPESDFDPLESDSEEEDNDDDNVRAAKVGAMAKNNDDLEAALENLGTGEDRLGKRPKDNANALPKNPSLTSNSGTGKSYLIGAIDSMLSSKFLSFKLSQVHCQNGVTRKDIEFKDLLGHARTGDNTLADQAFLNSRVYSALPLADQQHLKNAICLTAVRLDALSQNYGRLRALDNLIVRLKATHSGGKAARAKKAKHRGNLEKELLLSRGAKIMLASNLWTQGGLAKGTMATVRDFIWAEGKEPLKDFPAVIFVYPDNWTTETPFFDPEDMDEDEKPREYWVPIPASRHTWTEGLNSCGRAQFNIKMAWAITIHKSQGMTLKEVLVVIDKMKDHSSGMSYVALSRVKSWEGLTLRQSVSLARLQTFKTGVEDHLADMKKRYP